MSRAIGILLAFVLLMGAFQPVEAYVSGPGHKNKCEHRRTIVTRWYKRHPHREHRRWPNPVVVGWMCPA